MSFLSSIADLGSAVLKVVLPASKTIGTVGATTITASELETSLGSVGAYFLAMQASVKAKNYADSVELTVEEGLVVASDLGIGQPYVGLAKIFFPIVWAEGEKIAKTPVFSDGRGGWITQAWIDDPREKLDANGNFIDRRLIP